MNSNEYARLDEFLRYTTGRFVGFKVRDRHSSNGDYVFSGRVLGLTPQYVDVKPVNGLSLVKKRIHKSSILRLVGFNGVEYKRSE